VTPDSNAPIVQFRNICKTYDGEHLVVKDLNLVIRNGEFLTLLGPSGSGKTTALMMLAGFETPTQGEILLAGRSLDRVPPFKRDIGMVFQNYALFPHMTVAENIAFPLSVRHLSKAEIKERVQRVLDMVKLDALGSRRPAQLSGGQQQRVALARALVFEPRLILMDEPLGALDKKLREHMQIEIKHIHERLGVTVVYVTHDQGEALTMSNRIAVFNDGRILQIDAPNVIYDRPETAFVANFIGENNRLTGTLESVQADFCAVRLQSGERIIAKAIAIPEIGGPVSLCLRPEKVLLATDGDHSAENRLTGKFSEIVYYGDHARLVMELSSGELLTLKQPVNSVLDTYKPGAPVSASFLSNECRALDLMN